MKQAGAIHTEKSSNIGGTHTINVMYSMCGASTTKVPCLSLHGGCVRKRLPNEAN